MHRLHLGDKGPFSNGSFIVTLGLKAVSRVSQRPRYISVKKNISAVRSNISVQLLYNTYNYKFRLINLTIAPPTHLVVVGPSDINCFFGTIPKNLFAVTGVFRRSLNDREKVLELRQKSIDFCIIIPFFAHNSNKMTTKSYIRHLLIIE